MNDDKKLKTISERIYQNSFWMVVTLIFLATVGTAYARYLGTRCEIDPIVGFKCIESTIELIPQSVFNFIKDTLYLFVIPQTIVIIRDSLPIMLEFFKEFNRSKSGISTQGIDKSIETKEEING